VADDRDWGRKAIHGPYGRTLLALAATSLIFIVGYLTGPSTAAHGPRAVPVMPSPTNPPEDGLSSATLTEAGGCYIIRGFGLPVVASDGPLVEVTGCSDMIGSDRIDTTDFTVPDHP
jgi:hypothetical protein